MVIVIGSMRLAADKIDAARPHLAALAQATRAEDGCMAYDIAEDLFSPGLVRFAETWRDAAALAAHGKAPHIAPWRAAAADLGLSERSFTVYDADNARPL